MTVIALCYNHAPYVRECLESVQAQTYAPFELIVIDDASSDDSVLRIREFVADHPQTVLVLHSQNQGNCRSFNEALTLAQGEFVIDLACDDVMLPERLSQQVAHIQTLGSDYGVCFSNEVRLSESGRVGEPFYPVNAQGRSRVLVPQGDVYAEILARSFLPATTLLVRKSVFTALGGYDETLAYEDFDFWVRSSRHWKYAYLDAVTMHKRAVPASLGNRAFGLRNALLPSSLQVCRKARGLNRLPLEDQRLAQRVRYFLRQCWMTHHYELAEDFAHLLEKLDQPRIFDRLVRWFCRRRVPVHAAYQRYLKVRFSRP